MIRRVLSFTWCLCVAFAVSARATPVLQLDIAQGTYDTAEQSTIASTNAFTLYALGLNSGENRVWTSDTYYITAVLERRDGAAIANAGNLNFGSFMFAGQTVNATAQMAYGYSPLDGIGDGSQDSHGSFPSYFEEFGFKFKSSKKTTTYDVQSAAYPVAHNTISTNRSGGMYYVPFAVDVSNLDSAYSLHFDLYSESVRNGCIDMDKFAPFSHDASAHRRVPIVYVPEVGATFPLVLLAFLSFKFVRRVIPRRPKHA